MYMCLLTTLKILRLCVLICAGQAVTLKRTQAWSTFAELASILVNRIREDFSSLVTNRGFLLWVSNTVISQWTSNLNGD
jgi:hypothetical protein